MWDVRRENTKLQEHQFADWDWVKHSQNTCLLLFEQWKRYLGAQCPGGESVHHDWCAERIITGIGVAIYVKIEVYSFSMLCCVVSMCGGKQRREGQKPPLAQDFHGFHWLEVTCTREIGMYSVAI